MSTRSDVLKLITTGPIHMRVHVLAEAAIDTEGNTWAAGTRVAPLATGMKNDPMGNMRIYQSVVINGGTRTFWGPL